MRNYCVRKSPGLLATVLILCFLVSGVCAQNMFRKVNDFDGDGKSDFAVTRDEGGLRVWYVWQSTAGFKRFQWGTTNFDWNVAGDYDGDGKTDFAVCRPLGSFFDPFVFYVFLSQTQTFTYKGIRGTFPNNSPKPQDYDGDGKTDYALWSSDGTGGRLIYVQSTTGAELISLIPFGDFVERIGDMDGDGRAERVSRNTAASSRVTIMNLATNAGREVQFGLLSDRFVPADFDGDGTGDLTVFRDSDGTWWWIRSSDNVVNVAQWGQDNDWAVPGDYDGDGKTDLAIWRRQDSQGFYWIKGSLGNISVFHWGLSVDSPVTY